MSVSIDLSLDRVQTLVRHLPTYTRPTCHIAGTNGKGSVSSILSSILRCSSPPLSVGRYNSPHLISIHDCITINGKPVDPSVYARARAIVEHADEEHETQLSSFELLTVTALFVFEEAQLDIVVLEVGMGGRLDVTNIIPDEAVLVSALTAVDLDHQAFLGSTVAEIAKEKAGIARKGRPFVLGPQKLAEVEGVVEDVVELIGGDLVRALPATKRDWEEGSDGPRHSEFSMASSNFSAPPPQPVMIHMPCFSANVNALFPLYGDHQLDNLGVAAAVISSLLTHPISSHLNLAVRVTPETVAQGIKSVRWPGRLTFHILPKGLLKTSSSLVVLVDGAHNAASSATLGAFITHLFSFADKARPTTITYIISLSHSPPKTPLQTLSPIFPPTLPPTLTQHVNVNVACVSFTQPEGMPWVKSVAPADLHDVITALVPDARVWVAKGESSQLTRALEWAAANGGDGLVVVAGSLYLVADFYRLLEQEINPV